MDTTIKKPRSPIVRMTDVKAQRVAWLWLHRLAFSTITIIQGDPGVSKSTLALFLAALGSQGGPMPFSDEPFEPFDVILLMTAEDDLAATIKPRLEAAGADCWRIHAFTDLLAIPDDLDVIEEAIKTYKARLLIIDPLNAYLSGKLDGHKDQDVRQAMSRLKQLASTYNMAIVILHHMNKGSSRNALYRGGGSIAIAGAARNVLMVGKHPDDSEQRVLAHVKGNLGKTPDALAYRIVDTPGCEVGTIEWIGPVALTASSLLMEEGHTAEAPGKQEQAVAFLKRVLAGGMRPSSELAHLAREEGIAFQTYKNARKPADVEAKKIGEVWWSRLKSSEPWDTQPNSGTNEPLTCSFMEEKADSSTVYGFNGSTVYSSTGLFGEDYGTIEEDAE